MQITDADQLAHYGGAYLLVVTRRCGHDREIYRAPAIWTLGPGTTISPLRKRLRGAKCQGHRPHTAALRRQRN
jgi:hypothetical protein